MKNLFGIFGLLDHSPNTISSTKQKYQGFCVISFNYLQSQWFVTAGAGRGFPGQGNGLSIQTWQSSFFLSSCIEKAYTTNVSVAYRGEKKKDKRGGKKKQVDSKRCSNMYFFMKSLVDAKR